MAPSCQFGLSVRTATYAGPSLAFSSVSPLPTGSILLLCFHHSVITGYCVLGCVCVFVFPAESKFQEVRELVHLERHRYS